MFIKRYRMPRPRKYDYKKDYPVRLFIKLPVYIVNDLEEMGHSQREIEKIVEKYLVDFVEKNRKKD